MSISHKDAYYIYIYICIYIVIYIYILYCMLLIRSGIFELSHPSLGVFFKSQTQPLVMSPQKMTQLWPSCRSGGHPPWLPGTIGQSWSTTPYPVHQVIGPYWRCKRLGCGQAVSSSDIHIYIINPCCNFVSRIEGGWHPKNLRFWRALLHPYFATKSKTMGWQAPKNNPFLTFLDCILVGSWFCKWGPQQSAESVQNLTFWSWNWFCRNKAGDTLRSLIF